MNGGVSPLHGPGASQSGGEGQSRSTDRRIRGGVLGEVVRDVRLLLAGVGVPEPEIESRLIVQHALGLSIERLLVSMRDPAPEGADERISSLLSRRLKREPLPYITGRRDFFGRTFRVDRNVLVPRPETELLVERALEFAADVEGRDRPTGVGLRIADIGVGSGVLAITLALELPEAEVFGTDISGDALTVARRNGDALGAGRVVWLEGDLASPLAGRFDIVVSNPPYVPAGDIDLADPELRYEPRLALDGGPDGLAVIRRLIAVLPGLLRAGGATALIEADPRSAVPAANLAMKAMPGAYIAVLRDLAGQDRCIEIRTPNHPTSH